MKKIIWTTVIVLVVVVAVSMAAGAFDVIGTLRRMHGG